MKTKDLIRLLQEEDPSGEEQVCVNNLDIISVELQAAFYDGPLQVLEMDDKYQIKKASYKKSGSKVQIRTLAISDIISADENEFEIDYSELGDSAAATRKRHEEIRLWLRKEDNEINQDAFAAWAKTKAMEITADVDEIEGIARNFFKSHVSQQMSSWGKVSTKQMVERWESDYEVFAENGYVDIRKR